MYFRVCTWECAHVTERGWRWRRPWVCRCWDCVSWRSFACVCSALPPSSPTWPLAGTSAAPERKPKKSATTENTLESLCGLYDVYYSSMTVWIETDRTDWKVWMSVDGTLMLVSFLACSVLLSSFLRMEIFSSISLISSFCLLASFWRPDRAQQDS